ncbi:MAG: hypothetical protein H7144_10590 [Burkholderiales bacterium]|nr:hypothetical protein [Phycisphaerae bacterium]
MRRRLFIILVGTTSLLPIGFGLFAWPPSNATAVSIAKSALSHGRQIQGREPTDIIEANGIKLVSFGVIDGYDYVVHVQSRLAAEEVHRMTAGG